MWIFPSLRAKFIGIGTVNVWGAVTSLNAEDDDTSRWYDYL
jgi:hypothetical protein